ncbi:TRC40/GET3/ArsA family transport-energizing ATPase [Haloquadratum walsbyi]|nr:TRC40/GET3/ArsA family transport-energizing ATPase [Haloquadratum walsbyi]
MSSIDVDAVDVVDDDDRTEADSDSDTGGSDHDHTVDVETVDDATTLPDSVDDPEYVLYGGKGGVGKTTMAAATAVASATAGTDTLVVSTDPAHSLSDTFDTDVPPEPARIRDDIPLYAAEIDPDAVAAGPFAGDVGTDVSGTGNIGGGGSASPESGFDTGLGDDMGAAAGAPFGDLDDMDDILGGLMGPGSGAGAMPGADEAAAMQQLLAYLDDPRFDRVIVDTAPTGHTLRLLELPELMDTMLGRIASLRQQFSGMMGSVKGMFGFGDEPDAQTEMDLDELRERIERLRSVLRDPTRTDFRVVMIPEEMSVVESERLIGRLEGYEIPVQTLIINRVMEDLVDVTEVNADVDSEWVVSPNPTDCAFCQRRWDVQQTAIQRATDLFRGRDVKRVPLLTEEVRGWNALRVVAACLN